MASATTSAVAAATSAMAAATSAGENKRGWSQGQHSGYCHA
jgi:hypothetical protein